MKSEIIPHYIAGFAQLYGFLDERAYRDFCIKEEFKKMKNEGMKMEKIELFLSDKYSTKQFKLTQESIHRIVYSKKG